MTGAAPRIVRRPTAPASIRGVVSLLVVAVDRPGVPCGFAAWRVAPPSVSPPVGEVVGAGGVSMSMV